MVVSIVPFRPDRCNVPDAQEGLGVPVRSRLWLSDGGTQLVSTSRRVDINHDNGHGVRDPCGTRVHIPGLQTDRDEHTENN